MTSNSCCRSQVSAPNLSSQSLPSPGFNDHDLTPRLDAERDGFDPTAPGRTAERAVLGRIDRRRAARAAIGVEQNLVIGAFGGAVARAAIAANHAESGVAGRAARAG